MSKDGKTLLAFTWDEVFPALVKAYPERFPAGWNVARIEGGAADADVLKLWVSKDS